MTGRAEHKAGLVDEYRWEQDAQNQRAERSTGGYGKETHSYFGTDGEGDAREKRVNFKDYLKRSQGPKEGEGFHPAHAQEYFKGADLGEQHGSDPEHANLDELTREHAKSPHQEHFFRGYQHGWDSAVPQQRVGILVEGLDDMPVGLMKVIAHVSGNSVNILHCPFCGSGAVIGRSDGTVECGYCTSVFTVQVQPAYNGFPQSVDGQQYPWPGQPGPDDVLAPGTPPGTNLAPGMAPPGGDPMDPNAAGAPAVGGAPESSDPADGDNPFGDDEGDDDSENPFAKGKSDSKSDSKGKDDKKSDKKSDSKGGNPFAKKKSSWTKVASATHLHAFTYAPSDEEASSMVNKIRGAAVGTVDAMRSPGTRLNHPEVHVRAHRSDSKGTDFVNGLLNSGHWTEHTSSYKTANGAQLSEADYLEHLFIRTAVNKSQAIATVRSTRGL